MASFKLHLLRLARERVARPGPAFYLLLEGELVVDLPEGRYLHLRRGEAARVTEPHRLLPVERAVLLELG